jgi:hypothetical protein
VLISIVLRWTYILYKVRALNDMFLCVCTEVKIVKSMPRLTGYDQPTIAVITSLYCEKLAVDALIDDKTTFVKYKAEGNK